MLNIKCQMLNELMIAANDSADEIISEILEQKLNRYANSESLKDIY